MRYPATALLLLTTAGACAADIRLATDFQPLPFVPGASISADANGDGRPDLFFFTTAPNAVTIYFGNDATGFDPGPTHPLPANPIGLVRVADLNADGRDDIVIPNRFAPDAIHILPADLHGAYTTQVDLPTIVQPRMIAVTDADHDGATDIIVSRGDITAIHRNLGALAFDLSDPFPTTGGVPLDILAIDIHATGIPELAFLTAESVRMYRPGQGSYTQVHQSNLPPTPHAIAADDTLNTGAPSLLIASSRNTGISVLRTDGGQDYALITQPAQTFRVINATSVAFGDISGNGRLDVLHGFENDQPLSPLYRADGGSPLFRELEPPIARLRDLQQAHIADLNADQRGDLVLVGVEPPGILSLVQGADGTFRSSGQVLPTARPYRALVPIPGKANSPTYLATHNESGNLYQVVIQPQFPGYQITETPIPGTSGESANNWMLVDINADAIPDLVRAGSAHIRWQIAAPDGTYGLILERGLGGPATAFHSADLDADGTADFVWLTTEGRAKIAYGRTSGLISPAYDLGISGLENVGALELTDFNADNLPDLVFTDRTADGPRLHVALGRGGADFHPPATVPTIPRVSGSTPTSVTVGDFDRDGLPDVVVTGLDAIAFHRGHRDATLLPAEIIPAPDVLGVSAVDLDADRRPELIVNRLAHAEILSYAPGAPLSVSRSYYNPTVALLRAFHDIDRNGLPHLLASSADGITIIRNRSTPACIPDVVPDANLDFFDVAAFLSAFNTGDPAADLNDDGNLDFFDLARYLTLFSQGCP